MNALTVVELLERVDDGFADLAAIRVDIGRIATALERIAAASETDAGWGSDDTLEIAP